jgi:hypothetical protein
MIEKPLKIMIVMYSMSFLLLSVQYMVADPLGIDMKSWDGTPIKPQLLTATNTTALNSATGNIVGQNEGDVTSNPIMVAATIAWELFMLLTGTYIFSLLEIAGIPTIVIAGMVIIYVILLSRTIIGYLRGV